MSGTMIGFFVLMFISTVFGWLFSRTKKVEKPVKAMLFVLYFWGSFFVQLVIFSLLYYFGLLSDFMT